MLKFTPLKQGICSDGPTTLEVLCQFTPPAAEGPRVPVNLGLVLDRSGSMSGEKMELTLQAAGRAIEALDPTDYVTVVTFDSAVETIFSGYVKNGRAAQESLRGIDARAMTNLYGGWQQAVDELKAKVDPRRLTRLVLLTDGETNEGITEPKLICRGVGKAALSGMQTTTLGFGAHYNESLLREMASSGGGNHCYIEDAERLGPFFAEEMHSMLSAQGSFVRLAVEPAQGVAIEWMSEMVFDADSAICLADLVPGRTLTVMFRLRLARPVDPPQLKLRFKWHDLAAGAPRETELEVGLPALPTADWEKLECDEEVEMYLALAEANRMRELAMEFLDLDAEDPALQWLEWARQMPKLPEEERAVLQDLIATVASGDHSGSRKKVAMYGHGHGHGHAHASAYYAEQRLARRDPDSKARRRLPLGHGPILRAQLEGPDPRRSRVEGMLRGHFYGERLVRGNRKPLGEGAALSAATLSLLMQAGEFTAVTLGRALFEAPVLHPTTSQQKFRRKFDVGESSLLEIGSETAGCAALRRMCPLLLSHCNRVRGELYAETVVATVLTHRDNLALCSSLGYVHLLWKCLQQPALPHPEFYLNTFLEAIEGLHDGGGYRCTSGRGKLNDWQGHLYEFLPLALGLARGQALSAADAMNLWGTGPYLLEVLPNLIYILEVHADDPDKALRVAASAPHETETLCMLVGAVLGALHGSQPGWFLADPLEEMLDQVQERLGTAPV